MPKRKRHPVPVVGITGIIGSGKTILAKVFAKNGGFVIDADKVGREVLENDPDVINRVVKLFGEEILEKGEKISRKKVADFVFSSNYYLKKFNAIIHPPMIKLIKSKIKEVLNQSIFSMIVVDAALIFETGIEDRFDYVVTVYASVEHIIERLTSHRKITETEIKRRIKSQIPQTDKINKSRYTIENNGTRKDFEKRAEELFNKICSDFKSKN